MKNIFAIVFVLIGYSGIGQVNLNEYKYIIIPKTLGDFKEENQYLTSTLLKHLFVQKGFTAVYEDAIPEDLYLDRCLGLTARLIDNSSMFRTKVQILVENCKGEKVFSSIEGTNKIKEYKESYKQGITDAMSSFNDLNYSYKEEAVTDKPITISFKNDVKTLETDSAKLSTDTENRSKVVKQTSSLEDQSYKSMEPVASDIRQAAPKSKIESKLSAVNDGEVLYAQPIANGYQLIDSAPKVVMKLLNSSTKNVFIAQADNKSGMVFQKDGIWVFEYYTGTELIQEELRIKF
ncbi:hypothetical protein ACFQZJ_04305 [Maribacter chungangensis]|uniref:Uncharacterized protein n=1 Tax=Maribacter chungangensis TaxID=1069117 RepID=A0ABW3B0M9_9FLAO